jgi:hypothetical protein
LRVNHFVRESAQIGWRELRGELRERHLSGGERRQINHCFVSRL